MRQTKTGTFPTAKPVDTTEKPAEETAAIVLRERFTTFHAGAATRTSITAADRGAIDEIASLNRDYRHAADAAWSGMKWGKQPPPDTIASLDSMVIEYLRDCLDEHEISLKSGRKKMLPTVEFEALRGALVRDGDAVIQTIEICIKAGFSRVAFVREFEQKFTENVRMWLSTQPVVRSLVTSLIAAYAATPDLVNPRLGLLHSLRSTQQAIVHEAERAGEKMVPLFAHEWRVWLPIAQAVLLAEETAVAAT